MSQLETRKTWSTGELKNISMYYIFPVLNASRHCLSSPFFSFIWLLKEDLQIWALNLPSIFRYLFPRAANLRGFVKTDFQPTWSRVGEHNKSLSSGMMMMMTWSGFQGLVWSKGLKVSRSQGLKVSRFQGLKVSRSQGLKVSRSQGPKVPRSQGLKVSRSQGPKVSGSQGLKVSRSQGLKVSRS